MQIRLTDMKSKSLIKTLTLVFFFSLLTFFVLFQSGFIVRRSAPIYDDELYAKSLNILGDSLKREQLGLSTFEKLKLRGAFNPENFDASLIPYAVTRETHLSSSKSLIINWDRTPPNNDTYLESVLKTQFQRKNNK